ncbi:formylmethanofuran dehydrogenase subunit D [Methanolinea mesophila]|uniref:molybdopterin dinucleotide binding domain-containing protein n=1 Tax=Methanolinea mesophila TaxID=547055 RepID=UPI001AE211CB|nr:molybdopterin dinucleotide binding domain-containing protein [Methanolinea mesophila]MBP1929260.1 formylmethanofuran dehydrogenase subunit D [Methanolinea mesophila]
MKFLLNTGRTIRQGSFVERKNSPAYRNEASSCRMNPVDMMELGIEEGANVMVTGPAGTVVMRGVPEPGLRKGEVFVCLGPFANHIISTETHGTGMPDFKTTVVEIVPTDERIAEIWELMESCGGWRYEG